MSDAAGASKERSVSLPVGVVVRRTPGVTRWAAWAWKAVAVLPGAAPASWREMRRQETEQGEAVEYHAGTLTLTLHRTDTEAYLVALSNEPPIIYVVMRACEEGRGEAGTGEAMELVTVTASPFEAQDYADTGEEIVEPVPAPEGLVAFIRDFVARHHLDEAFVKRERRNWKEVAKQDGKGDARVRQVADVFRAPGSKRGRTVH